MWRYRRISLPTSLMTNCWRFPTIRTGTNSFASVRRSETERTTASRSPWNSSQTTGRIPIPDGARPASPTRLDREVQGGTRLRAARSIRPKTVPHPEPDSAPKQKSRTLRCGIFCVSKRAISAPRAPCRSFRQAVRGPSGGAPWEPRRPRCRRAPTSRGPKRPRWAPD